MAAIVRSLAVHALLRRFSHRLSDFHWDEERRSCLSHCFSPIHAAWTPGQTGIAQGPFGSLPPSRPQSGPSPAVPRLPRLALPCLARPGRASPRHAAPRQAWPCHAQPRHACPASPGTRRGDLAFHIAFSRCKYPDLDRTSFGQGFLLAKVLLQRSPDDLAQVRSGPLSLSQEPLAKIMGQSKVSVPHSRRLPPLASCVKRADLSFSRGRGRGGTPDRFPSAGSA